MTATAAEPRRRSIPIGAISFVVAVTVSLVATLGHALDWWTTDVLWVSVAVLGVLKIAIACPWTSALAPRSTSSSATRQTGCQSSGGLMPGR